MLYTNRLSWIGRKLDKQALETTHAVKLLSCVIFDLLASDHADKDPNKKDNTENIEAHADVDDIRGRPKVEDMCKVKEVIKEVIVEKVVEVPTFVEVPVIQERIIEVPVIQEKIVEVVVEKVVENIIETPGPQVDVEKDYVHKSLLSDIVRASVETTTKSCSEEFQKTISELTVKVLDLERQLQVQNKPADVTTGPAAVSRKAKAKNNTKKNTKQLCNDEVCDKKEAQNTRNDATIDNFEIGERVYMPGNRPEVRSGTIVAILKNGYDDLRDYLYVVQTSDAEVHRDYNEIQKHPAGACAY